MDVESMYDSDESENERDKGWYGCSSLKCAIMFFGALIYLDFIVQCIEAYIIFDNEHFEEIYFQMYVVRLCVYFVAVISVSIYFFSPDSPKIRAFIPWTFLIAAIANFLFAFWVIVFFSSIYEEDYVYVQNLGGHSSDNSQKSDKFKGNYKK